MSVQNSRGNPSKDRQQFVDDIILLLFLIGQTGYQTSKMTDETILFDIRTWNDASFFQS